ncbi:MAG TPA: hypothetical protein PLO25_01515 [Candidatus Saccharibacteria bacterium]|nr:hypothetical protein [Candidatus Saccharibacteria bacterium]
MKPIVILIAVAVVLFVSAYISRRRFGLLGLALSAGYILSDLWQYDAGIIAGIIGISNSTYSSALILSAITLLPAVLLLFHGYAYRTFIGRLIGASLFTLLALTFLIDPLSHMIAIKDDVSSIYSWLVNNREVIIGSGLTVSVIDLFMTKPVHLADKKRRH